MKFCLGLFCWEMWRCLLAVTHAVLLKVAVPHMGLFFCKRQQKRKVLNGRSVKEYGGLIEVYFLKMQKGFNFWSLAFKLKMM